MLLRHRILDRLGRRLIPHPLPLRLAFWDGDAVDFAPTPVVTVTMLTPRVGRMMLTGNLNKLCDAYVSGELTVDGSIQDILRVGMDFARQVERSPLLGGLAKIFALTPRHSRAKDVADIGYHYDVANEFYRLWLDRNMIYSCAYFRTGEEDIHTAQEQKLDHICRKLRLKENERFLDIGCGWGGLVRWAAKHYGVTATGVTISARQYDYAREWMAREGLDKRVEIRYQDYRDIPGEECFDKISSVGMYEHVGLANLPIYCSILARLLKAGGAVLNHGIYAIDRGGRSSAPDSNFIERHVFPGGAVPDLPAIISYMTRSGLETTDVEDLRPHYARTLLMWLRRLEAKQGEAQNIAGAERYRIWRMFMGGMAFAFDHGWISVAQLLAYKPAGGTMAARPWTRECQYNCERNPPLSAPLDWDMLGVPEHSSEVCCG